MNEALYKNFKFGKKSIKKDWDMFFVVDGGEGCLTGDIKVRVSGGKLCREHTIKHIYESMHGITSAWNMNIPRFVRSYNGKEVRLNRLINSFKRGKKEVYKLILENGKNIKATKDHKFLTSEGWKELKDIQVNDLVMCDKPHPSKSKRKRVKLKDVALKVDYHPYKNVRGEVEVHRLIYESQINNMPFLKFLDFLLNEKETCKDLKFINPSEYHIHHKDYCHYNNHIDNLELIKKSEHCKLHSENSYANFNQGVPSYSAVKSIYYFGFEETYDLECAFPHNNFSANEIIVHNCGKSVLALQLAYFCDPTFTLDRVVFKAEDFKKAVLSANKYQAIIFDEAYGGLASRRATSGTNFMLVDMMAEIRQRNLFIFLVLPSFFELDRYAAIHRSRALIHVYHSKFQRGYFNMYSKKQKMIMYLLGKKIYNYNVVKRPIIKGGRFTNFYPIDEEEYKKKKAASLRSMNSEKEDDGIPIRYKKRTEQFKKALFYFTKRLTEREAEDVSLKIGMKRNFLKRFRYTYDEDKASVELAENIIKSDSSKEKFLELKYGKD